MHFYIEINVLFLFNYFCVAFHGYSKGIFFHKLWLGLTRLMESTTSKVRTDQGKRSELTTVEVRIDQ